MKSYKMLVPVLATLALAGGLPSAAMSQQRGTQTQRAQNVRATADMRSRITAADERVAATRRRGMITPARETELRRQLATARQDMARLSRGQGFVSAAELATYDRMLRDVDAELSRSSSPPGYGDDMLPSAEMTAFGKVDARLRYRDARIEHDAGHCAVYQGIGPDGRIAREPLRDPAGRPICARP